MQVKKYPEYAGCTSLCTSHQHVAGKIHASTAYTRGVPVETILWQSYNMPTLVLEPVDATQMHYSWNLHATCPRDIIEHKTGFKRRVGSGTHALPAA